MMQSPHRDSDLLITAVALRVMNMGLIAILDEGKYGLDLAYRPSQQVVSACKPLRLSGSALLQCRLMRPRFAATNQPLIVFLHGAGERGDENLHQLKHFPEQMASKWWRHNFPCFLLAPQCPLGSDWSRHMAELEALIERVLEENNIDRSRVYLTGLSMGGFGSWELAARRPDLFTAIVPICGGGKPEWGKQLANTPIWAIHGNVDRSVPVDRSREVINAIRQAGGTRRYSELPGVGHDSWSETYSDRDGVVRWMFQQTK